MSRPPEDALAGMKVLVVGASRGIGLAVARALRSRECELVVAGRGEERLNAAAAEVGGTPVVADVTDEDDVDRLRDRVLAALGRVPDVVVNSAGSFGLAAVAETPVELFDRMIAVNLRAPFLLARAFLPAMLERRWGHLVTIGSIAGRMAFPHNGAYAASKFGVRGLHEVLDVELRGTGVRATLIEPAATDTPLWGEIDRTVHAGLPSRESMLSPDDVAEAVVFAVSRPRNVDVRSLLVERT